MTKLVASDSSRFRARMKNLDATMAQRVTRVVAEYTKKAADEITALANKPVSTSKGRLVRSRPGQPPRKDSGKLVSSVKTKLSPKGYVGTVSTGPQAQDSKGRRYPWMLESGTDKIKKRPLFKRVQRKIKKPYRAAVIAAVSAELRGSNT